MEKPSLSELQKLIEQLEPSDVANQLKQILSAEKIKGKKALLLKLVEEAILHIEEADAICRNALDGI